MSLFLFIVLALLAVALTRILWLYFPDIRRPWAPLLKMRKRFFHQYRRETLSDPLIEIHKSKRRLILFGCGRIIKEYRIALGTDAIHNKKRAGDGCTPEGIFHICTKNDKSRYHLFLGLDYPCRADAECGRKSGLIDEKKYRNILKAIDNGERPPWNTKFSGAIGIHGGGTGTDWTEGGIAM